MTIVTISNNAAQTAALIGDGSGSAASPFVAIVVALIVVLAIAYAAWKV